MCLLLVVPWVGLDELSYWKVMVQIEKVNYYESHLYVDHSCIAASNTQLLLISNRFGSMTDW